MADSYEVDFPSLSAQASEMMDAPEAPPVETPQVEAPPGPPAEVKAPAAPTLDSLSEEELDPDKHGERKVRVKIDGNWETKTLNEVANGYSRTSHFTRQMQDLARQRQEVEGLKGQFDTLQNERAQLQAFLKNPELVARFLQQSNPEMFAAANQPIQGDPDEIATVGQARDLIAQQTQQTLQRLQQMEQTLNERMTATGRDIESRRETAVYVESINTNLKDIFEKHPILNKVRMAEDIIRYEVMKMQPKSINEALEAFRTVADGMVEDLQEGYANVNKTKLATAAKLNGRGIEPPGGTGPQITPTTNFKGPDGQLDWKKLRAAAVNMAG